MLDQILPRMTLTAQIVTVRRTNMRLLNQAADRYLPQTIPRARRLLERIRIRRRKAPRLLQYKPMLPICTNPKLHLLGCGRHSAFGDLDKRYLNLNVSGSGSQVQTYYGRRYGIWTCTNHRGIVKALVPRSWKSVKNHSATHKVILCHGSVFNRLANSPFR